MPTSEPKPHEMNESLVSFDPIVRMGSAPQMFADDRNRDSLGGEVKLAEWLNAKFQCKQSQA
jgi:hypothetical protein